MSILDDHAPMRVGLRITQLMVAFLFGVVVIFLAVVSLLVATGRVERIDPPTFTWALLGAALITLPAVAFVRARILDHARKTARGGEAAAHLFHGWRTATLVMAAGLEGCALMCAVGALVDGHVAGILAGGVLALLLLVFLPTTTRFEHWFEAELAALG